LARIRAADAAGTLGCAAYRAARELLDRIGADGCTRLTPDALAAVTRCTDYRSARRLMRAVQAATGCAISKIYGHDLVAIDWGLEQKRAEMARIGPDSRTESRQNGANWGDGPGENAPNRRELETESRQNGANCEQNRAVLARIDPENAPNRRELGPPPMHARAPAVVRQLVSSDLLDPKLPTYLAPPDPQLSAAEVAQSEALLRAARMSRTTAGRLAAAHPFWRVQKAVARWWYGRRSQGGKYQEEPGIVVKMLDDPEEYNLDAYALPDAWWHTELGRYQLPSRPRRQPGETEAMTLPGMESPATAGEIDGADCEPEEAPVAIVEPAASPASSPGSTGEGAALATLADAWERTLDDLERSLPAATFDAWLRGTQIEYGDRDTDPPVVRVLLQNPHAASWVENRLSRGLAKSLSMSLGYRVRLEVGVARERELAG